MGFKIMRIRELLFYATVPRAGSLFLKTEDIVWQLCFFKHIGDSNEYLLRDWAAVEHKQKDSAWAIYFPSNFQRHWYRRAEIQWVFYVRKVLASSIPLPWIMKLGSSSRGGSQASFHEIILCFFKGNSEPSPLVGTASCIWDTRSVNVPKKGCGRTSILGATPDPLANAASLPAGGKTGKKTVKNESVQAWLNLRPVLIWCSHG